MSEEELRLAAIETLLIEMLAVMTPGQLRAMEDGIREGLALKGEPGDGSDEQTIRRGALGLIEDGRRRHDGFNGGILISVPKPE